MTDRPGLYRVEVGVGGAWVRADAHLAPLTAEHPTRAAAEAEVKARTPHAKLMRMNLRVTMIRPDADEARRTAPWSDGKPVTLIPSRPAAVETKKKK